MPIIGAEGQSDQAITSVSEAAQRDWRRVLQNLSTESVKMTFHYTGLDG